MLFGRRKRRRKKRRWRRRRRRKKRRRRKRGNGGGGRVDLRKFKEENRMMQKGIKEKNVRLSKG